MANCECHNQMVTQSHFGNCCRKICLTFLFGRNAPIPSNSQNCMMQDDAKMDRKSFYLLVKTIISNRVSLKSISEIQILLSQIQVNLHGFLLKFQVLLGEIHLGETLRLNDSVLEAQAPLDAGSCCPTGDIWVIYA